jgi:small subunit ribosomal protein S16
MLRIRLRRVGKKNQPNYRIVVVDSRVPRDGSYIEKVGFYNPLTDPPTIELDLDRAKHWLSVGAQPSDPVALMLKKQGLLGGGNGDEGSS